MPAITEQDVLSALKSCYDPEIPVNIVDLGLIYKVDFASAPAENPAESKQDVTVEMTLTARKVAPSTSTSAPRSSLASSNCRASATAP